MNAEVRLQGMYTLLKMKKKRSLKFGVFFSSSQKFLKMKKLAFILPRSANEGNVGKNWGQVGIEGNAGQQKEWIITHSFSCRHPCLTSAKESDMASHRS